MAAVVVGFAIVGVVYTARRVGSIFSKRNRRERERYEIAAAALSAIFGVRIISEEEAKAELAKGNPNVQRLDIKDIFKTKPRNFNLDEEPLYYIPDSAYDPQYDYDFTNHISFNERCTRGDYPYKRPAGWKRKAVNVLGKYKDDIWLGKGGWRSESSPGEWPVSYHGTKIQNIHNIITDGYDNTKCKRALFGKGIYSTPHFDVAEQYATEFNYKQEDYKCILQNRVNLEKTKQVETVNHGTYFITPDEVDIRPYGVCIKKI